MKKTALQAIATAVAATLLFGGANMLRAEESQASTKAEEKDHDHDHDKDHDHDHDKDHDHDHDEHAPAKPRYENVFAYYAKYELKAGEYALLFGHTHEHSLRAALIKIKDEDEKKIEEIGKKMMKAKAEETKQEATIKPDAEKTYEIEMAHNDGIVNVSIEEDGTYALLTNMATEHGGPMDFWLVDEKDNEVEPKDSKVYDDTKAQIYHGYFEDDMVQDRTLAEWKGDWKSVYPLLQEGKLDDVMKTKAETGSMSAEEYKEYYLTGYKTDVDRIKIDDKNQMTFTRGDKSVTATYKYEGYKILQYKKGNRGVRFLFTREGDVEGAPLHVQFSDHNIAPSEPLHFHLFFGDQSHEELLEEMDNWPTYYPVNMSDEEIAADMLAH